MVVSNIRYLTGMAGAIFRRKKSSANFKVDSTGLFLVIATLTGLATLSISTHKFVAFLHAEDNCVCSTKRQACYPR